MKLTDIFPVHLKEANAPIPPSIKGKAATSSFGVQGINKNEIEPTIRWFANIIGIPYTDFHVLGSTGKTPTSGDIDLAIDAKKYDINKVHAHVMQMLDGKGTYNKGTQVGSYAVPIMGTPERGFVQIDIMPSNHLEWTKFAYWSPGEKSKYKGAVRNALLRAVVASVHEPGIDAFLIDPQTGNWLVRVGRGFNYSSGIKRMYQIRGHKKTGEWNATLSNSTPEEIQTLYPELQFDQKDRIIRDPKVATELLFGPGVTPADVETAEQIIELINRFPEEKREDVLRKVRDNFSRLPKGTDLPQI